MAIGVDEASVALPRPRLRGVIHRYAAMVFAAIFLVLVITADGATTKLFVGVYAVGVTTMLAVSAVYHSGRLSPRATRVFKRIDHSTILLAIAGSYTAIVGLALQGTTRAVLLALVWTLAVTGIVLRMAWLDAPYPVVAVVYIAVGWVVIVDPVAFTSALPASTLALIVVGGLLYSVGAAVYALHRPNLAPEVFGYHELFHALVVGGAACHLAAVITLL